MRYCIRLNDPDQPSVMADDIIVDADQPPDSESDPQFILFTRNGVRVGFFRKELVQAIYEVGVRRSA